MTPPDRDLGIGGANRVAVDAHSAQNGEHATPSHGHIERLVGTEEMRREIGPLMHVLADGR